MIEVTFPSLDYHILMMIGMVMDSFHSHRKTAYGPSMRSMSMMMMMVVVVRWMSHHSTLPVAADP
jgi:hypothetical protein